MTDADLDDIACALARLNDKLGKVTTRQLARSFQDGGDVRFDKRSLNRALYRLARDKRVKRYEVDDGLGAPRWKVRQKERAQPQQPNDDRGNEQENKRDGEEGRQND